MTDTKTAIVTGASSGIGLGLATTLLERGYRVVANSRRVSEAGTLTPAERLILVDGNISEPHVAAELVAAAVGAFGAVDLLLNNAGIFISKPFVEYTTEEFLRLVFTNLAGFFHVTQEAVRQMRTQRSGHIVNVTTSLADQPIAGVPAAVPILTKGGLNAVTRALAIEYAGDGIRVNAVAPGIVDTPMHNPENHDFLKHLHPIARLGTTQEIVDAALFLVRSPFITGEVLHVDGGAHAGKWGPIQ